MSDQQSGAAQWRAECTARCASEVAQQRRVNPWTRMHSEVSYNNREFFISENRVGDDMTAEALRELLDQHDHVLVCNNCGAITAINSDGGDDKRDKLNNQIEIPSGGD